MGTGASHAKKGGRQAAVLPYTSVSGAEYEHAVAEQLSESPFAYCFAQMAKPTVPYTGDLRAGVIMNAMDELAFLHRLGDQAFGYMSRQGREYFVGLQSALKAAQKTDPGLLIPNNVWYAFRCMLIANDDETNPESLFAYNDIQVHHILRHNKHRVSLYGLNDALASHYFQWYVLLETCTHHGWDASEDSYKRIFQVTASNVIQMPNIIHATHRGTFDAASVMNKPGANLADCGTLLESFVQELNTAYKAHACHCDFIMVLFETPKDYILATPLRLTYFSQALQELQELRWRNPLVATYLLAMDEYQRATVAVARFFIHHHRGSMAALVSAILDGVKTRETHPDPPNDLLVINPPVHTIYDLWAATKVFDLTESYAFIGQLIRPGVLGEFDSNMGTRDMVTRTDEEVVTVFLAACRHYRAFFQPIGSIGPLAFDYGYGEIAIQRTQFTFEEIARVSDVIDRPTRLQDLVNILAYRRSRAREILTQPSLDAVASAMGSRVQALIRTLPPLPEPQDHERRPVRLEESAKNARLGLQKAYTTRRKDEATKSMLSTVFDKDKRRAGHHSTFGTGSRQEYQKQWNLRQSATRQHDARAKAALANRGLSTGASFDLSDMMSEMSVGAAGAGGASGASGAGVGWGAGGAGGTSGTSGTSSVGWGAGGAGGAGAAYAPADWPLAPVGEDIAYASQSESDGEDSDGGEEEEGGGWDDDVKWGVRF